MKIGLGGLRYTPEVFWNLSLREFILAVEGYAEARGAKSGRGRHGPAMTTDELEALAERYPDEPRASPPEA